MYVPLKCQGRIMKHYKMKQRNLTFTFHSFVNIFSIYILHRSIIFFPNTAIYKVFAHIHVLLSLFVRMCESVFTCWVTAFHHPGRLSIVDLNINTQTAGLNCSPHWLLWGNKVVPGNEKKRYLHDLRCVLTNR